MFVFLVIVAFLVVDVGFILFALVILIFCFCYCGFFKVYFLFWGLSC